MNVVLVGHSYARFVVRKAADRVPHRVKALVVVDAWVGTNGESPPEFVGVSDDADAAWLTEMCSPQPLLSFTGCTSLNGAVDAIPTHAILCRDGLGIPFRQWSEEFGWPVSTIDCGHDAMVIEPERLAQITTDIVAGLEVR